MQRAEYYLFHIVESIWVFWKHLQKNSKLKDFLGFSKIAGYLLFVISDAKLCDSNLIVIYKRVS